MQRNQGEGQQNNSNNRSANSVEQKEDPGSIKVENLDIGKPIDEEMAIKNLGIPDLFYYMLGQFEEMMLHPQMEKMAGHLTKEEWFDMKFAAHSLKGSAGYIGVSRLHYACYYVQYYFM